MVYEAHNDENCTPVESCQCPCVLGRLLARGQSSVRGCLRLSRSGCSHTGTMKGDRKSAAESA